MRLINVKTFKLESFADHRSTPPYAILSHTWGGPDDEVLFHEMAHIAESVKEKEGWKKIEYTCAQAKKDDLDYAWVDTCCIDKSSSAELSEAINSMFAWYQKSRVCYAYLVDVDVVEPQRLEESRDVESDAVPAHGREINPEVDLEVDALREPGRIDDGPLSMTEEDIPAGVAKSQGSRSRAFDEQFQSSMWFTRGWTLQELLAPDRVEFFSRQWQPFGSLEDLAEAVSRATTIPLTMLYHEFPISSYRVAKRMSWASRRATTRREDEAYSLLGIFQVNMALLYGEGKNAFKRLQEEILRTTEDLSLLAWDDTWKDTKHWSGDLFAISPADFINSGQIRITLPARRSPISLTSNGIRAKFLVGFIPRALAGRRVKRVYFISLNCYDERVPTAELALATLPATNTQDPVLVPDRLIGRLHLIRRQLVPRQVNLTLASYFELSHMNASSRTRMAPLQTSSSRRYHLDVEELFPNHRWDPCAMTVDVPREPHRSICGSGFKLLLKPKTPNLGPVSRDPDSNQSWHFEITFSHGWDLADAGTLFVRCYAYVEGEKKLHSFSGDHRNDSSECPTCSQTNCKLFTLEPSTHSLRSSVLCFNGLGEEEQLRLKVRRTRGCNIECTLVLSVSERRSSSFIRLRNELEMPLAALAVFSLMAVRWIRTSPQKLLLLRHRRAPKAYKGPFRPHDDQDSAEASYKTFSETLQAAQSETGRRDFRDRLWNVLEGLKQSAEPRPPRIKQFGGSSSQ